MKQKFNVLLTVCIMLCAGLSVYAADENPDTIFNTAVESFNAGKYDEAISLWEKVLPIYKQNGDTEHEAMIRNNIGLVHFYLHDYEKSLDYFKAALAIDRKRNISKDIATDLQNLGMAYYQLGNNTEALSTFNESASIYESIDDLEGESKNLYNMGIAESALGEYTKAGAYFSAAADLHRNIRDRQGYVQDILELGDVYVRLGRFDKSVELYDESLKVREVLGDKVAYVRTEIRIARAYMGVGRYDDALVFLKKAERDAKDTKKDVLRGDVIAARGDVLNAVGDWKGALEAYNVAMGILKKGEDLSGTGMILTDMGIIQSELFKFSDAAKSFEDARLIYQVLKEPGNEAKVIVNMGNLANTRGELDAALSYYDEADKILGTTGDRLVNGVRLLGVGEVYLKKQDYVKARAAFTDAAPLLGASNDKRYGAKIDAYLGLIDFKEKKIDSAQKLFSSALLVARKEGAKTLVADFLIGNGSTLLLTGRPDAAGGYFLEAKRLADDLGISSIGWRAVYFDGLMKRGKDNDTMALARYEDALFRLTAVPEVSPNLYTARMIAIDDLFNGLTELYNKKGDTARAEEISREREGLLKIETLFTKDQTFSSKKEEVLIGHLRDVVGEINYFGKRLADDEYRKGGNADRYAARIVSGQGKYLKALDDIKDDAPGLWNDYFRDVYK